MIRETTQVRDKDCVTRWQLFNGDDMYKAICSIFE